MKEMHFKEVTSTNDMAKSLIKVGETDIFITGSYQSKGRGKQGSKWFSEPNRNLYLSFTLPIKHVEDLPKYAIVSAVGIKRVLDKLGFNATIKKPNDILINSKKVCGILCEAEYFEKTPYMIVGVGLNIFSEKFPDDIIATSLILEDSTFTCDIIDIGRKIANEIKLVFNDNIEKILEEYK